MTNPMLAELDEVLRLACSCTSDSERMEIANEMAHFILTHHAEIADMAKRLEAAERDARRYRWLRVRLAGAACVNDLEEYNQTMHSGLASDVDAAIDATQEGEGT